MSLNANATDCVFMLVYVLENMVRHLGRLAGSTKPSLPRSAVNIVPITKIVYTATASQYCNGHVAPIEDRALCLLAHGYCSCIRSQR